MKEYTLLVEIGTEELPPKILKRLGKDFYNQIIDEFKKNNIHYIKVNWFASPCHLAVKATIVMQEIFKSNIIYTNQINKNNINLDHDMYYHAHNQTDMLISNTILNNTNLQKTTNFQDKLSYDYDKDMVKNQNFKNLFNKLIFNAIEKLTNYKMMHWGDIDMPFIRPVRTMTILLNTDLISGSFFGVNTDRVIYGNRCMEKNEIILHHAHDYPEILIKKGWVIVNYNIRKDIICVGVKKKAKELGGIVDIKENDALLEEVTSLVEWPIILCGQFDKKFLKLPYEVLLYIMKHDQKYFPVYHPVDGVLLPYFIFVANTISKNYKKIIIDHENIIMTRLMDAEFFLKYDSRNRLEDYLPKLDSVLFHRKLGTLRDKIYRIEALSGWIASQIGEDVQQAKRAGYLCKCDLVSNMVFEFPFTQGIIGMYYARRDGESEKIALAQKEHYQPRFSEDELPVSYISCIVSIADKIDTISGMFGVKELPKGNRDPFALKRLALGILRILIEKKIPLNLLSLIKRSIKLYGALLVDTTVINDIYIFMRKRLYAWYLVQGYKPNIIQSVLNIECSVAMDFDIRIKAINNFCTLQKKENIKLNMIYKRISHILSKKQVSYFLGCKNEVKKVLLKKPEELNLFKQIILVENNLKLLFEQHRYYDALIMMTTLFHVINQFFENVLVMDNNPNIQTNRLILLDKIRSLFLTVADISLLHI